MAFLYIGPSGKPHRKHSYSAGSTWDHSNFKYYLQKVLGWREKNKLARFELGKAFESSFQYYHENRGDLASTLKHFETQWNAFRDSKDLQFTRVEKDWSQCLRIGTDWLKLYAIRQPSLPIPLGGQSVFQRIYGKEVFPGDANYGEIEFEGRLDVVSFVDPQHPMLPKLDWKPEYGAFRPIIVDIKTAGADFPEQYGIAAYDIQLRLYSWVSGIRDVSMCWFVKKGLTIQKGYSVTLLEDAGFMKAGQEAVVAMVEDDGIWLLANDFLVEEMERVQGQKNGKTEQTKVAKERKQVWLNENGTFCDEGMVTKQRLQFNAGFVTVESAEDAGKVAGRQIVSIVNAWKSQSYPDTFSVRYPHDDRSDPYFRAFVLKEQGYKESNFTKSDEDIDIFAEEDNEAI
jgi:hypothetical protein